jgi:hypothetical protein
MARLARSVAAQTTPNGDGAAPAIAVGFAVHCDGETTREGLLAAAADPRIRIA